jgi:hypothetical protein
MQRVQNIIIKENTQTEKVKKQDDDEEEEQEENNITQHKFNFLSHSPSFILSLSECFLFQNSVKTFSVACATFDRSHRFP